jgi:hypothetical protein
MVGPVVVVGARAVTAVHGSAVAREGYALSGVVDCRGQKPSCQAPERRCRAGVACDPGVVQRLEHEEITGRQRSLKASDAGDQHLCRFS